MKLETKFNYVVDEWMRLKATELSPSSIVKYRGLISKYIKPYFNDIQCSAINNETINDFLLKLKMSEADVSLSNGTKRTIIMILNKTCAYGYAKNYIEQVVYVKPCLSKKKPVVETFSTTEQKRIEKYIFSEHNLYSLAILLALYSGMRIGEICALKWEDIDISQGAIYVKKTVYRLREDMVLDADNKTVLIINEPKSACSYRVIPIPKAIIQYIQTFKKEKKRLTLYLPTVRPNR